MVCRCGPGSHHAGLNRLARIIPISTGRLTRISHQPVQIVLRGEESGLEFLVSELHSIADQVIYYTRISQG